MKKYLKTARQKEKELRKTLSTMESIGSGKETDSKGRERNLSDSERYERWKEYEKSQKNKQKQKSKPSKKATKILKKSVKRKKRKVDDFTLDVTGNGDKTMKEYSKENLDFTSKGFKNFQKRG